jgi:carboxy-terminal domain RNA polymerase II polypeptide A small phosphatase
MSMYKRPFLDEFLEHLFDNFEVVFYTSAIEQYANLVLDEIDPDKRAISRLFRDS